MKKRILGILLILCMTVVFMPTAAGAETIAPTLDIAKGSIVITDTGYTQGEGEETPWASDNTAHAITITGTSNGRNLIDIASGTPTVTLKDLSIKQTGSGVPAIALRSNSTKGQKATLVVKGKVELTGGPRCNAIFIGYVSTLTIQGAGEASDTLNVSVQTDELPTIGSGANQKGTLPFSENTSARQALGYVVLKNLNLYSEGLIGQNLGTVKTEYRYGTFGDITIDGGNLTLGGISLSHTVNASGTTMRTSKINFLNEPQINLLGEITVEGTVSGKYRVNTPSASFDMASKTLTNVSEKMEYSLDGTNYESVTGTTVDLSEKITGPVTIYVKKLVDNKWSIDSNVQEIVLSRAEKPESPTLASKTETSITVAEEAGMEYKLGENGQWQPSGTFTGLEAETGYSIYARVAATADKFASEASDALTVTTAAHAWASEWSKDETGHWHACANCTEKNDFAAHTPGADATETTAQTCTVCDYEIAPATGHIDHSHRTLVKGQAATCTVDGWKDYYKCNGCDKLFDAETGGNEITLDAWKAGDGKIAAAHAWASEWSKDETGHWHACANCTEKNDFATHTPGAAATETTPQTCTICGYEIAPATGHIDHSHRTLVKGQAATCTVDGWKDYYKCNGCDKLFDAETGGNEITLDAWKAGDGKIAALGHKLNKHEEVPATKTEYGTKAYWTCSVCQKNFSDAEGKTEIPDLEGWKQKEGRINKKSSGGGGSYIPVQKPVIEKNDNVKTELSSDGSKLTIKPEEGYTVTDVTVNGVSKGAVTEVTGLKTGDKIIISTEQSGNDTGIDSVKAELAQYELVLRSKAVKMKNGKKAIRIIWYDKNGKELNFDGIEIYRSVKRYSGYGKAPIFTSTSDKYFNTAVKKGTKYYYKVRGVRTIDGENYYTEWSTKAWRTV